MKLSIVLANFYGSSILIVSLYLIIVKAYPSGAPLDRCSSMYPGHDVEPLKDSPPYHVSVVLNPNKVDYDVTIASSANYKFKGFLIEARGKWDGNSIGKWSTNVKRTKTINCFDLPNSAVTHNLDDDKGVSEEDGGSFRNVTFTWTRPKSTKLNRVKFIATIVKKFDEIYLNVSVPIALKDFKSESTILNKPKQML